tara:strand:- start:880 stop:1761 length:882 start_codon:yes stop_codon:yes gene_type:complete
MAVPSSGSLSLFGIAKEVHLDNYNNTVPAPGSGGTNWSQLGYPSISLGNMSTGAGGFDAINSGSSSKPNGSTPHSMSEFYGYDHDASGLTLLQTITGQQHSTQTTASTQYSIGVSAFKGKTVRAVFHYVSGSNYTGDVQLDLISMPWYGSFLGSAIQWQTLSTGFGGSTFSAGQLNPDFTLNGNWETNTNDSSSYTTTTFGSIGTSTSAYGRWVGRSGGTPSGGTGLTSSPFNGMHVYAETSSNGSGFPSKNFWLRSPEWDHIDNEVGTPYFTFYYGAYGATIGTMRVYFLEV